MDNFWIHFVVWAANLTFFTLTTNLFYWSVWLIEIAAFIVNYQNYEICLKENPDQKSEAYKACVSANGLDY